jgi:hypothetical protein
VLEEIGVDAASCLAFDRPLWVEVPNAGPVLDMSLAAVSSLCKPSRPSVGPMTAAVCLKPGELRFVYLNLLNLGRTRCSLGRER